MAWYDFLVNDPNVNMFGVPHGEAAQAGPGNYAPTFSGDIPTQYADAAIGQAAALLSANTTAPTTQTNTPTYKPPAAPAYDPAQLAQYDQAIGNVQSSINRQPGLLASGTSGIDAGLQNALNALLLGRNQGESAYSANKQQNATDYVGAKNTVGANAGEALAGLWRLLGSRGAGGSSAYNRVAPGAVARGASIQRAGVGNQFASNEQSMDTGWGNYLTDYNNQVSGVNLQGGQQKQELQRTVDTNTAGLLQSLAQLQAQRAGVMGGNQVGAAQPYLDQANTLLDRSANYTTAPLNYQTQAYTPPSLASYTSSPLAAPTYEGQTPNDYFSPYLQSLLGKKQQLGIA